MKMEAQGSDHGRGAGGSRTTSREEEQDTTYTKIFVGGLAWETHRDAMRRHFEQYGDILEAVVIADKVTGRSKGYGFVTFQEPEAARKACLDPTPVIDGRRANCNLASLGAHQRARPMLSFMQGNRFRAMAPFAGSSPQLGGSMYMAPPAYVQQGGYAVHYGYPYQSFGYSYSPELLYHSGMYNPYAGLQYLGPTAMASSSSYPYGQFMHPASQNYSMQLPQATQYGRGAPLTNLSQHPYALLPPPSPTVPTGPSLEYFSASTIARPGLRLPQQIFPVQQPQPFSQVPKAEHPFN